MNGVNTGRAEAGVVVLRPVQCTRPTSLSFHVPVEGERVRWQPEGAGRPDDRSAEHLRQVVMIQLHQREAGGVLPAWEEVDARSVRFWGRPGKLREVEESLMLALPCLPRRSPSQRDDHDGYCHDHDHNVDDGEDGDDGDDVDDHDDDNSEDDDNGEDDDDDGEDGDVDGDDDGEDDHLSKAFHFQVFCSLK